MNRFKILRVYFFIILFIAYGIFVNKEDFIIFFKTSVVFNSAITIMFIIGIITLFVTTVKLYILQGNLEKIKYNFSKMKKSDYSSLQLFIPQNIIQLFFDKIDEKEKSFSPKEKDTILDWIDEDFKSKKTYIAFTVETSLMLGLLGTFVGLLISINGLGDIVDLLVNMKDLDIKVVLESFGGPLKGMAVGFGSSLFGVTVGILLNIFMYLLNKNYVQYFAELTEVIDIHLEPEELNVVMEEQLALNNKELVYMSEIYKLLKNMNENNTKQIGSKE